MTDERQDSTNYEEPHVKEHNHFNPVITDVSGNFTYVNPAMEKAFEKKKSPARIVDWFPHNLFADELPLRTSA